MSLMSVSKDGKGDNYETPKYVVEILLPYLRKTNIRTIWCPFDKAHSEYVKVLKEAGYIIINGHIDEGKDFFEYEPEQYDAIISNPPFSKKNEILERCITLGKPFALLLSATCIQSASLIEIIAKAKDFNFIMFNKRISYSGDRPPFPSWYFTSQILDGNKFYLYERDPKELFREWEQNKRG
jgi:hypothetical protein